MTAIIADDPLTDPDFARLLRRKPRTDPVPALAWWLTAELLRRTIEVNTALTRGEPAPRQATGEALLFADLALDELAPLHGGARPPDMRQLLAPADTAITAAAVLRRAAAPVARLLLTSQPTQPVILSAAVARLRRVLERARGAGPPLARLSVGSTA